MSIGALSPAGGSPLDPAPEPQSRAEEAAASAPTLRAGPPDTGRLLTKKLAGERVLLLHRAGRPGLKCEAKVIPGPDREHYVVKLHRLIASPPFGADPRPEALYSVDRRDGRVERLPPA